MLKHNLPETTPPLSAPRAEADTTENSLTEIETVNSSYIENPISDYLDQVMSSLVGSLPETEISERRAEMRSHIVAMTNARLELGDSVEIALQETLAQFGQPLKLQAEWIEASENVETFKTSFVKNVKFFGIQYLVVWLLHLPLQVRASINHSDIHYYMYEINTHSPWGCYLYLCTIIGTLSFFSTLAIGFLRGYRGFNQLRKLQSWMRSVVSIVIAHTLVDVICLAILFPLTIYFTQSGVHVDMRLILNYIISGSLISVVIFSVIGVAAGCLKRFLKRRIQIAT